MKFLDRILGPSKKTVSKEISKREYERHIKNEQRQRELLSARLTAIEASLPYIPNSKRESRDFRS